MIFTKLRAAFDSIDREILSGAIRQKALREGLVIRKEEVLRETRSKMRMGEYLGREF